MNTLPLNAAQRRQVMEGMAAKFAEMRRRQAKAEMSQRGYRDENGQWQGGLLAFIRYFWPVLEPGNPFVDGWPLWAICQHLESVTFGEIQNLLINVSPGFMKSLVTDVFWPAWEWGPMEMPHIRYVAFSYSSSLTQRDNGKFRDLMLSPDYQAMFCRPEHGDIKSKRFSLRKTGEERVTNSKHGFKLATSIGGVGTGERGDRIILDDPHNVKESESETVRTETIRWFRESMTSRLNNMQTGNKIVIMQRVHEGDISGTILDLGMDYVHLIIPMEYVWQADENNEPYATSIGWVDPRWTPDPEDSQGELAWPERWPAQTCVKLKKDLGEHAYAGQYQQTPEPRGGGIFKRAHWQPWEAPDGKFPAFSYVVASLDSAYTEDQENDPSALTVWGVFHPQPNYNRVMLVHAWQRWLEIQGPKLMQEPNEGVMAFRNRSQKEWGLIEWVHHTCNFYKVDRLLIEGKASGISVAQMLRKVYQRQRWSIIVTPVKGDKVARAYSVQPSFSQEMVYYPHSQPLRKWVDMTINQMALFPRAKHDDLTDSACQAIKHLRDIGLLTEDDEVMAQLEEDVTQDGSRRNRPLTSLYPC
jgi:predicted phage terminase large subunit-like protein